MDRVAISKTMAHALRHDPAAYGLTLDSEGWVTLDALVGALAKRWPAISRDDVTSLIDESAKKRYEISGERIRAGYGHSTADRIDQVAATPPDTLFHGTQAAEAIERDGLRSMRRQYVHLSTTEDVAREVGSRRGPTPTIFRVDAKAAHDDGVVFYRTSDPRTWLVDSLPARYLARTDG
ncbi:RNA 2'-phosphotransferase [Fodinicola acaciae]|uniref:RNA 2'-phosphotransferase n=1 Tax=Fodinicola acaciae TaxID=2681555 RepID=UPI001C9E79B2|nr:RNA 2'-phosphotransferase [Fodinicola acaciae]